MWHFLAFGLYLASLVILYGYYANYIYHDLDDESDDKYRIAFIVSNTLSFVSQICLCYVMWQLVRSDDQKHE